MANEFKVKNGAITPKVILQGSTSGTTTLLATAVAGTTTLTLPAATDTLVGLATTDTLTNKTLTSPTITGGALSGTFSGTPTLSNNLIVNGTGSFGSNVSVNGLLSATTKSFIIDHPTKEGMKLRYGSLEGPENGVYVRGKTKENIIELPDYWTALVDSDSITVNLTPIGNHQNLFVDKIENNKVYISNSNLINKTINCFFTVFAERCDVEKIKVEYAA